MNMDRLLLLIMLWMIPAAICDNSAERRDFAKYDGYTAEEHYVMTGDGYILGLFRIPPKENCTKNKGPIMFVHGLYLSGDDCIVPGPGKAHCYIYSDNCYDVWVPNVRGNLYSRNHTSKNPDKDPDFWDFSIDDMAMYDVPAVIDHVLKATNSTQLSYIGHSQGFTILLILRAKKAEYNAKIKVIIGISATAWTYHSRLLVIQLQSFLYPILAHSTSILNQEILSRNALAQTIADKICGFPNLMFKLCSSFIFAIFGDYNFASDVLPAVIGHIPSGSSLKNFFIWGQIKNNGFTEYDYGPDKNRLIYGSTIPPLYNLTNVSVKTVIMGSYNDNVANITDVRFLVSKLSNVSLCILSDEKFAHLDFVYGKDLPKYITPTVMSMIETGNYNCI